MYLRAIAGAFFLGLLFLCFVLLLYPSTSRGAECLRPGEVLITSENRAVATAAGIPADYPCWIPGQPYTGASIGESKIFLQQHSTKNVNVACFNPEFAEQLKNLLQSVPGGPPTITDGYRSPADQIRARASGASKVGPCGSYHQYGLAADFNDSDQKTLQWMRMNASRFGLAPVTNANPATGCTPSGFCDYGHIQIAARLPSRDQCGLCSGDQAFGLLQPTSPTIGAPSSAFSQAIRNWFSPPQQAAVPTQPAIPSQPASANPLESFNENNTDNEIGGVSSQINTGTISSGSSTAANRLEELAFGPKPATTTTTSVPLVISGSNAVVLTGSQNTSPDGAASTQGAISPSQTTFVSGDLSWQEGTESVSGAPVSGMTAILITIKATLLRLLQYLVPFAPRDNVQIDGSGEFHTLE